MSTSIAIYDVVVVGAGPGGAYAAWRAKTGAVSGPSPLPSDPAQRRVLLLESSGRIGGRLESIVAPGTQGLVAEFGGMGFTEHDTIFTALVDQVFKLPAFAFPHAGNLAYVRGVRLSLEQRVNPALLPYRLTPDEQNVIQGQLPGPPGYAGPVALVAWAAESAIPGCLAFNAKQWAIAKREVMFDGRHLRDIGFWNFLLMSMSNEALSYVHDMFGHFFEIANWNCAEALPWFLGDGTTTYRTLSAGYDQLPKTLVDAFTAAGGQLMLDTPVVSVTAPPAPATGLLVNLASGSSVLAGQVVLAMPRRALQRIAPGSVVLDAPWAQPLIESVTGQSVMKLFLTFQTPWWTTLTPSITEGSSSTDLPVGQCWYFTATDGGDSLLMASYNDTLATSYWEGLAAGPRFPTQAANPPPRWVEQAASQAMVDEVVRQLALMHGIPIPTPTGAAYMNWSRDPFGGAFDTWNVGVDAAAVEAKMLRPDPTTSLYICGDAYSSDQGWTEGALATAERVMQRYLGVVRRLKGAQTGELLIEALQASPHCEIEIEPHRSAMPVRAVKL